MPVVLPLALGAAELAGRLEGRPGLAWLDGDGTAPRGLRSYVASDPIAILRAPAGSPAPFDALRALGAERAGDPRIDAAPRYVGFVAYDAAWSGDARARHARSDADVLWFGRYDAVAVFEHDTGRAYVVADDDGAANRFEARLASTPARVPPRVGPLRSEDPDAHLVAVRSALASIGAGDVYQINLTRRFDAALAGSALALFEAMRHASPVPFGMFLDGGERVVLGRSMERFLAFDPATRRLETRPIKGTVATHEKGDAPPSLARDPKEHAEHTMVVDLMRNDLGRVATPGSVRVEEAFAVEPFARLAHLVSTIACRVRDGLDVADVLRATFPPGSVTGTPKSRAVSLIEALERGARDVYCGAYGFVARDGGLSLAVAIRTAVLAGGTLRYDAGGGIVSESDPLRETEETELKTRVLRDALDALAGRETQGGEGARDE